VTAPSGSPVPPTPRAPSPQELRRGLARLKMVPTLPRLLQRIIVAVDDPTVHLDYVAELIEVDQALASQILRLANSAFYGSQGKVSQVKHALVLLGAVVTRCLVLATTVLDLRHMRFEGLWEHALGTAVAGGAIARVTGRGKPEEIATAGLLHDLGKVMLCKELPDVFALAVARAQAERRSLLAVEREILGVDHAEVGGWLAEQWRLPAVLAEPIRYHHAPGRARQAVDETAVVHVADSLVRGLGYGSGGDPCVPDIDPAAWQRLDLSADVLDRVLERYEVDLDHALNYAVFD
jgi:HD-like signal output (HDOD) protein